MDEARIKAEYIKAVVANYFRKIRRFPMVALEAKAKLKYRASQGDRADILAVTPANILIEAEVKTSIADLKNDIKKEIHKDLKSGEGRYPVHYFCFAILEEIEEEAKEIIKKQYPYAGLFVVREHPRFHYPDVDVVIGPKKFKKPPLNSKQIREMEKIMSSNICRMAAKLAKII